MSEPLRAVVITESLEGGRLPEALRALESRRYPHLLDERTQVEIIELAVPAAQAAGVALTLADAVLPRLYYAHLIDSLQMLVAFPDTVVRIHRDDAAAVERAQSIGALFDIPAGQMRFAEMWDTDHPDAPARPEAPGR
ncbi:hypothetical protein [Streptomyces sp. bgisy084]|uniref:hypothetical protein n=1 Tax=unclassified Streptomyces TaxID=2593676 RepID=UPI003D749CFD